MQEHLPNVKEARGLGRVTVAFWDSRELFSNILFRGHSEHTPPKTHNAQPSAWFSGDGGNSQTAGRLST